MRACVCMCSVKNMLNIYVPGGCLQDARGGKCTCARCLPIYRVYIHVRRYICTSSSSFSATAAHQGTFYVEKVAHSKTTRLVQPQQTIHTVVIYIENPHAAHRLHVEVWVARVVQEPSDVSLARGVDEGLVALSLLANNETLPWQRQRKPGSAGVTEGGHQLRWFCCPERHSSEQIILWTKAASITFAWMYVYVLAADNGIILRERPRQGPKPNFQRFFPCEGQSGSAFLQACQQAVYHVLFSYAHGFNAQLPSLQGIGQKSMLQITFVQNISL